jgi:hypothetical protein
VQNSITTASWNARRRRVDATRDAARSRSRALQSGLFSHTIDVKLDRFWFRLAQVSKQDDQLALTFEDRDVAYLRQYTQPKKASRSSVTRAEFALSLVREVKRGGGITFVCPELHVTQPIAKTQQGRTDASRARNRDKGLPRGSALTVKGAVADSAQKRLAERVLDVADSLSASSKATLALMEACIVESLVRNLSGGDADSRGVLQVRDSTARSMGIDNRDVQQCANAFLTRGFTGRGGAIALTRAYPTLSAGGIAQAVQGSAYPDRYDGAQDEARAFISAYGGGDGETGTLDVTQTRKLPYQFRRGDTDGTREDSWVCLNRLAEEVKWRCFMSAGACYFVSETQLLKAKPRLVLSEDNPAVLGIDFDVDSGKPVSEVTISARANRWVAAPGAVVELRDVGVANGRWLVATLQRGIFDANATITLRRPTKALPEPAPETETTSSTVLASTSSRSVGAAGSQVERAYQAARVIDSKRYPYVWGGGHASAGSPSGGGYDCSGAVSAVLAAAGMGMRVGGSPMTSVPLMTWGEAGRGNFVTVYASVQHAFMVFHTASGDQHFGTGDWGKGWGGAGFNPRMHPTSGFAERHWPGT